MTGRQLQPVGDLAFEELVDVYKEQAQILVEAGVDLFFVETMMSLAEARACVIAIREVCDLPVMVSMTFNSDGKTLFGSTPEASVVGITVARWWTRSVSTAQQDRRRWKH